MLDIPKHYIDTFKCRLTEIESVFKAVNVSKNFFLLIKLVQNTIINLSAKVKGFSVSLKRKYLYGVSLTVITGRFTQNIYTDIN